MKLAKNAFFVALTFIVFALSVSAQTLRSEDDPRNTAPTVGTGGPVGGPTGLFTVYDGQTLRRGEYTFSASYSNFDRDPGNVDFSEVPVNFQIGLSDHLELFFNTDAYRAVKVNSPRNLSGFYLPNSQFNFGSGFQSAPAIVLAPQGPGTSQYPGWAVFRPQSNQVFAQYPYVGANAGTYGFVLPFTAGGVFGFPTAVATLGPARAGGNGADLYPGIGSIYGGILPGIVLSTVNLGGACTGSTAGACQGPVAFTSAPTYLPDAPFLNRRFGESAFSTYTAGGKWRWTGPDNPVGAGVIAYYRWFADKGSDASGFNQLQRGASPGGNRGDIGVVLFGDARLRKWVNISGNVGYNYNSSVKANGFTLLDRPDEFLYAVGADFPVNKYFQPILEARATQYVGGRTPNAFENSPIDLLAGARVFATRWMGFGFAYRHHWNQQDSDSFDDDVTNATVNLIGRNTNIVSNIVSSGVPVGFNTSSDPHGFILNGWIGRRNSRGEKQVENKHANVDSLDLENSENEVNLPCPAGTVSRSGKCNDDTSVGVRTKASDPENDVLTYNYTVSGGRIVGSGANVNWDLSGVQPGTYTITAGVDDGCGVCGQTQTKTITVKACDDCYSPCNCPTLSVSGPSDATQQGGTMTFTANVSGGSQDGMTYNWTVSSGTIIDGQGSPVIRVAAGDACPADVTATVEIAAADLCADCAKTASASGSVVCKPVARQIDEYGKLPNDEVKNRVDNFWIALQNEPGSMGYVVNYGSAKEMAASEKQVRDAIAFRGYDISRFTFVNGGGSPRRTVFWVVPAGADAPTP